VLRQLHRTIKKVGDDSGALAYNTAIAAMMEYMNHVRRGERTPHRDEVLPLVQLAAAYAPHLAEECWARWGMRECVRRRMAQLQPAMLVDDKVDLVVQVNGKSAASCGGGGYHAGRRPGDAQADAGIAKFLVGEIKKVIFVPKRLLYIVVG
jgi:leucyl-tRNA synthetase